MNTTYDLSKLGGERTVYVRPVKVSDLPADVRAQAAGISQIYAVHTADGEPQEVDGQNSDSNGHSSPLA